MNEKTKKEIADTLNKLPFVVWDRYIDLTDKGDCVIVYGWINREKDSYKDFVVLHFYNENHPLYGGGVGYTTSSSKYSAEIGLLLYGTSEDHTGCLRVEHDFESVKNVVKL